LLAFAGDLSGQPEGAARNQNLHAVRGGQRSPERLILILRVKK